MRHQEIHPSIKPSFSPNLHAFVRKWNERFKFESYAPQVWRDKHGMLWIGRQDSEAPAGAVYGFSGVRLFAALCTGAKAMSEKGWHPNLGPANMTHIENFWDGYKAVGRCAIDPEHSQSFITKNGPRYTESAAGGVRTCLWCGAQHRIVKTERQITEVITSYLPIEAQP